MGSELGAAWSSVAESYARYIMPGYASAAEALVRRTGVAPGHRVLDVACGPGTAARAARALGARQVTGVDIAPGMLTVASRLAAGDPAYLWIRGDAVALPVASGRFDVLVSSFGLVFAPDPSRAAAEAARVLDRGGRLGLLAWPRQDSTAEYYDLIYRFLPRPTGPDPAESWGTPAAARQVLAPWFGDFEFQEIPVGFEAPSPAEAWRIMTASTGRAAVGYRALDSASRDAMDRELVAWFDRRSGPDGAVRWDRQALFIGARRAR